jgi:hypothetical protein
MAELQVSAGAGAAVELRVGGLFGRSFGVFRRHVVSFCLLGGIAALPYLLPAPPGRLESPWAPWLVMLLAPVTQAVILYGTFQDMRGRPFGIGESFTRGLSRFFPIIGLTICWGIVVAIGLLLLVIPGLIWLAMFFVAFPACVVERLGPIESMTRSAELTKGVRWRVFAVVLVVFAAAIFVLGAFDVAVLRLGRGLFGTIGNFVWQAVYGAYFSVLTAVLYSDLRRTREGIDLEQIAAVFD